MMGKHREAIREIVAEADADPEQVMALVRDWVRREGASDPDFTRSFLEEFGEPVPRKMIEAIVKVLRAAKGDSVRATALLNEALDHRENPTESEAVWGPVVDRFMEALRRVIGEEIARYEDERPPGD
jgi:AcrR family transcriptional regulator